MTEDKEFHRQAADLAKRIQEYIKALQDHIADYRIRLESAVAGGEIIVQAFEAIETDLYRALEWIEESNHTDAETHAFLAEIRRRWFKEEDDG